jgi:hypothetical protein
VGSDQGAEDDTLLARSGGRGPTPLKESWKEVLHLKKPYYLTTACKLKKKK